MAHTIATAPNNGRGMLAGAVLVWLVLVVAVKVLSWRVVVVVVVVVVLNTNFAS
jgi:hypothetical protein